MTEYSDRQIARLLDDFDFDDFQCDGIADLLTELVFYSFAVSGLKHEVATPEKAIEHLRSVPDQTGVELYVRMIRQLWDSTPEEVYEMVRKIAELDPERNRER